MKKLILGVAVLSATIGNGICADRQEGIPSGAIVLPSSMLEVLGALGVRVIRIEPIPARTEVRVEPRDSRTVTYRNHLFNLVMHAIQDQNMSNLTNVLDFSSDEEVNVNSEDGIALIEAVKVGNVEILRRLIRAGLDVNAQNKRAAGIAIMEGKHDILKALIKGGLNAKSISTLIVQCAFRSKSDYSKLGWLKLLRKARVNFRGRTENGGTLLIEAVKHTTDVDVIEFLINRGVDPNIRDNDGKHALTYAEESYLNAVMTNQPENIIEKYYSLYEYLLRYEPQNPQNG